MAYVITDRCIGTQDTSCVDACPVDCIHPRKDEPQFSEAPMLFIDPGACIDCGCCVPVCPMLAVFPEPDVPTAQHDMIAINAIWYSNPQEAIAAVAKRMAAQPATKK